MKEVGKRLKALRESLGLSQVKMAEAQTLPKGSQTLTHFFHGTTSYAG